jgi:photosystem II stability/assembly factor-like uncharacterized protein
MPLGPSPLEGDLQFNGLVSAIAIHPSNPDIIYIGTGSGGLWKSINGGETWNPLFDRQQSLGVGEPGALAIDPSNPNILYVGASNRINKGTPNTVVTGPTGLFKSTDEGYSWIRLGSDYPFGNSGNAEQFDEQNINVVIVDPASPSILYLASNRGVFRSIDGGVNWTRGMTPTGIISGDAQSLVLDTSSAAASRILYAGISTNGVFRSNDGGLNWTRILDRTTPAVQTALGTDSFGKVIVDIAPPASTPNPAGVQNIYVSLERTGNQFDNNPVGIFISRDQGGTWSKQASVDIPPKTQNGYSFHMAVDPGSPGDGINDIIYVGCVGQRRSDDSGNKFEIIHPGIHADTHAWAFVRQPSPTPSIVYNGNDGGLFKSTDRGSTWIPINSGLIQTALFYNISLRPNTPGKGIQVGATQDNDVRTTATALGLEWKGTQSGDVWDVAFDGSIAGQVYASRGFNGGPAEQHVVRSTDDGLTFPDDITPWIDGTSDGGTYKVMIATDPNPQGGGILYVSGSQYLWRSFDGGDNWRKIAQITGSCDSINVARGNSSYVVIAIDAKVYVSTNALQQDGSAPFEGVIFSDITRNLPSRFITRVAFDPADPSTIYAVFSGFNSPGNIGHVFRTNLGASGWTDISPNLNAPCSALALEGFRFGAFPTRIYVGTEFGVLRSVDGGSSWYVLDEIHFPRVPVLDLEIRSQLLVAATYGRGAFAFFSNIGDPVISMNLEHNLAFGTVQEGPKYLTLRIFNVGDPGRGGIIVTDLVIESVQRLMGSTSFSVLSTHTSTPVHVRAGDHIDFTIEYAPKGAGVEEIATIRIISNDPYAPYVDLSATGMQAAYD